MFSELKSISICQFELINNIIELIKYLCFVGPIQAISLLSLFSDDEASK